MSIREQSASHVALDTGSSVCFLRDAQQLEQVGGKAYNLARMISREIRVPNGLVITDHAFQSFLDSNGLRQRIEQEVKDLEAKDTQRIQNVSDSIRELVLAAKIDSSLVVSIRESLLELNLTSELAVRSSAVGEDSLNAAFAGQLDSFLQVDSETDLEQAILGCWASYWSTRVLFYQHSRGIQLQGMAVIVQEMVKSELSGILFTKNPGEAAGDPQSMVVEYCQGFGDELAGGAINPGRLIVDPNGQVSGVIESRYGSDDSKQIEQIKESGLFQQAVFLEESLGCPQDIEWTIDRDGLLFLVQTRPITVIKTDNEIPSVESESQKPIGRKVLWSNANVNENYPDPISPLLYSIASSGYYHYFRNLGLTLGFDRRRITKMENPLRNIIGVHGGRMYYNLSNIHSIIRDAPGGQKLSDWFDQFVGTDHLNTLQPEVESIRKGWLATKLELGKVSYRMLRFLWSLEPKVTEFESTVDEFATRTDTNSLTKSSLSQLHGFFREFIDIRCNRWTNASLADLCAMVTYGLLKQFLANEFPGPDQAGLHNTLLKGLQNVVSGKPVEELWRLSRLVKESSELTRILESNDAKGALQTIRTREEFSDFKSEFDRFTNDWGFRCSGELMLTTPNFQEQPEQLLKMIQAYVASDGQSPLELLAQQSDDRVRQTAEINSQLKKKKLMWPLPWPNKGNLLKTLLKRCHVAIAMRERARLKQAFLYSRLRFISLAIGERLCERGMLEDRNDVFFLSHQELDDLLSGTEMFPHRTKDLVRIRKTAHEEYSSFQPEDSILLPEGDYQRYTFAPDDETHPESTSDQELRGTGACGGQATGVASVLTDVAESEKLRQGDILVTRQTDPGWGPVFFLIKGLVMERGGMLSHGAILAREFGIPTIVGIKNATSRIRPGDKLVVDGDSGFVRLVD